MRVCTHIWKYKYKFIRFSGWKLKRTWSEFVVFISFVFYLPMCFFSWLFNILSPRSFNFVDISPITSQLKVASGLIFIHTRTHTFCVYLSFVFVSFALPHTHWWFEWREKKSNLERYTEIGDGLEHRGNKRIEANSPNTCIFLLFLLSSSASRNVENCLLKSDRKTKSIRL